jgi:hypothetical protein
MSLHPGEQGVCSIHGLYDEYCGECTNDKQVAMEKLRNAKRSRYYNCPACPSQTYISPVQPNLVFTLYVCNTGHKFYIKEQQKPESEKENNNNASDV